MEGNKNKSKTLWVKHKIKEAKEKNEGRFIATLYKYFIEDSNQCNKYVFSNGGFRILTLSHFTFCGLFPTLSVFILNDMIICVGKGDRSVVLKV